jgi:hypothetical protein
MNHEGGLDRMKKLIGFMLLVGFIIVSAGCSLQMSPVLNNTDLSRFDFSNASSLKEGASCATYVLGLGPFGNTSVMEAIKAGGITTVKVVDYKHGWYLLVSKDCVVVYGE